MFAYMYVGNMHAHVHVHVLGALPHWCMACLQYFAGWLSDRNRQQAAGRCHYVNCLPLFYRYGQALERHCHNCTLPCGQLTSKVLHVHVGKDWLMHSTLPDRQGHAIQSCISV